MNITTTRPLPLLYKIERDKLRSSIKKSGPYTPNEEIEVEKPKADFFTIPFTDFSLQGNYDRTEDDSQTTTSYSINSRNIMLGQDVNLNVSGQNDGSDDPANIRLEIGRQSNDSNLLGFLGEYKLGDISSNQIGVIADASAGRGIYLSSLPPGQRLIDGGRTITLRGNLAAGYQVDLKRNGELINFISEPTESGEYLFENVDLFPGINDFELVFYGPQGHEYTETERIFTPIDDVRYNEFNFNIFALQDNTNLFTDRLDSTATQTGRWRYGLEAEYGIGQVSSIYGSAIKYQQKPSVSDNRDKPQNFGQIGLKTTFKGIRVDAAYSQSDTGSAISLGTETIWKGLQITSERTFYNDLNSEVENNLGITKPLKSQTSISVSGSLPFLGLNAIPITFKIDTAENKEGDNVQRYGLRTTHTIKKLRLTNNIVHQTGDNEEDQTDYSLQLSSRFENWNIRGLANYNIQPESTLDSMAFTADWLYSPDVTFRAGVGATFNDETIYNGNVGINYDLGPASIGANISYDTDNNATLLFGLSSSFAYDPRANKYAFSSKKLAKSSGYSAQFFEDLNYNNIYDDDEPPIENVSLHLRGDRNEQASDKDGNIFVPGLDPYRPNGVSVDLSSLGDPLRVVQEPSTTVELRPSQIYHKNYAVQNTGEIDGNINIFKHGRILAAPSIQLDIIRDNEVISKTASEYDGFFLLPKLPLLNLALQPNNEQIENLGYCPTTKIPFSLTKEDPVISIKEPIILYPDPTLGGTGKWITITTSKNENDIYDVYYDLYFADLDDMAALDDGNIQKAAYYIFQSAKRYNLVTGPFTEAQEIQFCSSLPNHYECHEPIKLTCDDYSQLTSISIESTEVSAEEQKEIFGDFSPYVDSENDIMQLE